MLSDTVPFKNNEFSIPQSMQKLILHIQNAKNKKRKSSQINALPVKRQINNQNQEENTKILAKLQNITSGPIKSKNKTLKWALPIKSDLCDESNLNNSTQFCNIEAMQNMNNELESDRNIKENDELNDEEVPITQLKENLENNIYETGTAGIDDIKTENTETEGESNKMQSSKNYNNPFYKNNFETDNNEQNEKSKSNLIDSSENLNKEKSTKKWVTFSDIVRSDTDFDFVDELYEDSDSKNGNSPGVKLINKEVSETAEKINIESRMLINNNSNEHIDYHQSNDAKNNFSNYIQNMKDDQEKLKNMIRQVNNLNQMIIDARQEILRFTYKKLINEF